MYVYIEGNKPVKVCVGIDRPLSVQNNPKTINVSDALLPRSCLLYTSDAADE